MIGFVQRVAGNLTTKQCIARMSAVATSAALVLGAQPAQAQWAVIDAANLANSARQVQAWAQQAQQMVDQINQLQQQHQQLVSMTQKFDGARALGTILNDPNVLAALPPEMRDISQLVLNPAALGISQASLTQMLASFGVNTGSNSSASLSAADALLRAQQIMASTQARARQLNALAQRVDTTGDAKDSLDMVNRNVLEAANVNNQMMQTLAALEAARQSAELRRAAEDQALLARMVQAGAR